VLLASLTHLSSMTSVDSAELEGSSIFAEVWPRLEAEAVTGGQGSAPCLGSIFPRGAPCP
jgi:hypothetical protein